MASYTGYGSYQGYDPERAKVDRARQMAELLQQGATDTSPKSFWEGAAQLGKAFIARGAMDRADKQETAYGDSRRKAAEMLIDQRFDDPAAVAAPLSLTPENVGQTAAGVKQGGDNQKWASMARAAMGYTGDLGSALSMVDGMQRQEIEDKRYTDQTQYARGRDAVGDQRWNTDFNYRQGRDAKGDEQWQKSFDQSGSQFDKNYDLNVDQFGESKRHNQVVEGQSAAELQAKAAQAAREAEEGGVFGGAQKATIFNKSMTYLDEVNAAQKDLDFVAGQAQQFLDATKDGSFGMGYWAQGEGPINDIAQAWSMDTTKLKAITDSIAPLMRRPGSGASSDTDVKMFKSAVTNINNTPEANKRFAQGAQAMAERNREYGNFLNDAIDPNDVRSRQKAQKLWNMYAAEAPIFDQKSGEVMTPIPFKDWLAMQMGEFQAPDNFVARQGAAMANMAKPAPAQDGSDLVSKWLNK